MSDTFVFSVVPEITINLYKNQHPAIAQIFVDTGAEDLMREVVVFESPIKDFAIEVMGFDDYTFDEEGYALLSGSVKLVNESNQVGVVNGNPTSSNDLVRHQGIFYPIYKIPLVDGKPLFDVKDVKQEILEGWKNASSQALSRALIGGNSKDDTHDRPIGHIASHKTTLLPSPEDSNQPPQLVSHVKKSLPTVFAVFVLSLILLFTTVLLTFAVQAIAGETGSKSSSSNGTELVTHFEKDGSNLASHGTMSDKDRQAAAYQDVQAKTTEEFLKKMGINPAEQTAGLGCLTQ